MEGSEGMPSGTVASTESQGLFKVSLPGGIRATDYFTPCAEVSQESVMLLEQVVLAGLSFVFLRAAALTLLPVWFSLPNQQERIYPSLVSFSLRCGGLLPGRLQWKRQSRYEDPIRGGRALRCMAEMEGGAERGICDWWDVPGGNTFEEMVIGKREGRKLRYVAWSKNGLVPATRREVMTAIKLLHQVRCLFFNLPEPKAARWGQGLTAGEMAKCRWVKPVVKVRVAFLEWTDGKHLRHSRFL